MVYGQEFYDIAISYVIYALHIGQKLITVLHDHQFIVADQTFFFILDSRADTGIVPDCPLVGTAQDDGFVFPVLVEGVGNLFDKVSAADTLNIVIAVHVKFQFLYRKEVSSRLIIL